jgi:predicted metal-dependent phosphoesterase TrpH
VIDLHLHTNVSDGQDTPEELAARCREVGITVFAVTDHDTTAGWAASAEAAAAMGLTFLRGVEITAVLDERDVHVLGYFPGAAVPMLDDFLEEQRQHRVTRVYRIAERLQALGCPIDVEAVLRSGSRSGGKSVGRPRIADALIERGYVASRDEAFRKYLATGCSAFVPRTGASPAEVVELIGGCGGVAALAHPGLLNRDDHIPTLILAGMPAIEVFHSDHDEETRCRYERLARRSGLLMTGGSDYHGPTAKHGELGSVALPVEHYEALLDRLVA